MRRILGSVLCLVVAGALTVGPAEADRLGRQGCTPAFWKANPDRWQEATPAKRLQYEFMSWAPDLDRDGDNDTFMDALNYRPGSKLVGRQRILLRVAVAAWLNAATEEVGYPRHRYDGPGAIVPRVRTAIASEKRARMTRLTRRLNRMNHLGCPID